MNPIQKIVGKIIALWALILFSVTLIIACIPISIISLWPEPKKTVYVFKVLKPWMKVFFVFTGVKRIITGKEHFKKGENYVVVCNHNSFMDIPLSSPGIPGPNKTIAKAEMARIPLFGMIYKTGSVLVDRKNEESRRNSFIRMKDVLHMGLHMCIYPEGTRNQNPRQLQRFHDGAFKLAVDTGKQIIPTIILDTTKVLPRKGFCFWPHPVQMHFLPPVSSINKSSSVLKDEIWNIMNSYIHEHMD
jgi:1-acyl-sn-glycerol-3-phosphate acyltransferase